MNMIPSCIKNVFQKLFPKPSDKKTIFGHYVPLAGVLCHSSFLAVCLNPRYSPSFVSRTWLINGLFIGSTVGVGCFVFYRKRIADLPNKSRVADSLFFSVLFTCGTVVIIDPIEQFLPENTWFRVAMGVCSSILLFAIGKQCSNDILDKGDDGNHQIRG